MNHDDMGRAAQHSVLSSLPGIDEEVEVEQLYHPRRFPDEEAHPFDNQSGEAFNLSGVLNHQPVQRLRVVAGRRAACCVYEPYQQCVGYRL